jgi:hypothetical protein
MKCTNKDDTYFLQDSSNDTFISYFDSLVNIFGEWTPHKYGALGTRGGYWGNEIKVEVFRSPLIIVIFKG